MTGPNIAFLRAQWHAEIVENAVTGFREELGQLAPNATVAEYRVPGAFELPLLARRLAKTGRFDAIVAAALVVDGGIYRHDFVAQAVVSGLMQVQLETDVPVFSVSLTPHNFQPTEEHTEFFREHFIIKGAEAARAVTATLDIQV